jgi:hypothetical protein
MRTAAETDFAIPLPEVGEFIFARRTMGDMIKIRSAYLKLIGEDAGDYEMEFFCGFAAAYQVLIVSCPEGWEYATGLDLNRVGAGKVQELAILLSEKESSFRRVAEV